MSNLSFPYPWDPRNPHKHNHHHFIHPDEREVSMVVDFLHNFPRFGAPNEFSPFDEKYSNFLQFLAIFCFSMGLLLCMLLAMISVKRVVYSRPDLFSIRFSYPMDIVTVILLGTTALSALSGIIGEAQIDYGVETTSNSLLNTSTAFQNIWLTAGNISETSSSMRAAADDMMIAFDQAKLPSSAVQLAEEANRLTHDASKLFLFSHQLPDHLGESNELLTMGYMAFKRATNTVYLMIMLASMLAISGIAWSSRQSLKVALCFAIFLIPLSYGLMGYFMSNSIVGGDFCVTPLNNTMKLFEEHEPQPLVKYFVECKEYYASNETNRNPSPFLRELSKITKQVENVDSIYQSLHLYAINHTNDLPQIEEQYLNPINNQLHRARSLIKEYNSSSSCVTIHKDYVEAIDAICSYGVLGQFALWIHQVALGLFLFMSVIALISVYERVHARDQRLELQYHLLASYEEDDVQHLYLSSG